MRTLSRCPECSAKIPVFIQLFLGEMMGFECANCGSQLNHSSRIVFVKFILLIMFLSSFVLMWGNYTVFFCVRKSFVIYSISCRSNDL